MRDRRAVFVIATASEAQWGLRKQSKLELSANYGFMKKSQLEKQLKTTNFNFRAKNSRPTPRPPWSPEARRIRQKSRVTNAFTLVGRFRPRCPHRHHHRANPPIPATVWGQHGGMTIHMMGTIRL
jgi:hypothetical protein